MTRAMTIALVLFIVFLYMIRTILLPFVVAGILAYVCTPLVDRIARHLHAPRAAGVVIVFVALAAAASLLGWWGIPPLIAEFQRVAVHMPDILRSLADRAIGNGTLQFMGRSMTAAQTATAAMNGLRELLEQGGRILILASWSFAGIFGFFLGWVLFFYFLIGAYRIGNGLMWLVPPERRPFVSMVWLQLDPILRRYFVGIVVVVTYACIAAYVGLGLILDIHHALFLALLTGLLEMIPVVGPGVSAVVAGLMAVAQAKGVGEIIAYVIYAIALRLSIDQLLGPIVLGKAARLPPVLVIFSFLAGAILFGVSGVIAAVPVALTIKVVLATLYGEKLGTMPHASRAPPPS